MTKQTIRWGVRGGGLRACWLGLALFILSALPGAASASEAYSFGVVMQRSPILTAEYWNPILGWVSRRSGVPLRLKLGKTGEETSGMVGRGEFDFAYTNHNFLPDNQGAGYRVIARPTGAGIRGQLVVLDDSGVKSLAQLRGQEVAFPHRAAFVGYVVTMDGLIRAGIDVKAVFAGNQEGAIGQLRSGRVVAASVNSQVIRDFADREGFKYRVLWSSDEFHAIPVSAHPRVPATAAHAVRDALIAMASDPEGLRILEASAGLLKQPPPFGFVAATDTDYEGVKQAYRSPAARTQ